MTNHFNDYLSMLLTGIRDSVNLMFANSQPAIIKWVQTMKLVRENYRNVVSSP